MVAQETRVDDPDVNVKCSGAENIQYGFINCKNNNLKEKRALLNLYKNFFSCPKSDPLDLDEACRMCRLPQLSSLETSASRWARLFATYFHQASPTIILLLGTTPFTEHEVATATARLLAIPATASRAYAAEFEGEIRAPNWQTSRRWRDCWIATRRRLDPARKR